MSKVIDFREYKKNKPKNKVIEIDFKTKTVKKVQEYRGDRLVKETEKSPLKLVRQTDNGDDIA